MINELISVFSDQFQRFRIQDECGNKSQVKPRLAFMVVEMTMIMRFLLTMLVIIMSILSILKIS